MDTASGAPQGYPSTPGLSHLTTQAEGQTVSYTLEFISIKSLAATGANAPGSYAEHSRVP
jgi:hypothetical protein